MAKNTEKNAKDYNIRARDKYRRCKTKTISVTFNIDTEKELLDILDKQDNKSRYIKNLIMGDAKK